MAIIITRKMRDDLEHFVDNLQYYCDQLGINVPSDEDTTELLKRALVLQTAIECLTEK